MQGELGVIEVDTVFATEDSVALMRVQSSVLYARRRNQCRKHVRFTNKVVGIPPDHDHYIGSVLLGLARKLCWREPDAEPLIG